MISGADFVTIESSNNNYYIYSVGLSKLQLVSPLQKIIIENEGKNAVKNWYKQALKTSGVEINGIWYKIEEINYQMKKYEFLKDHGFFDCVNTDSIRNKRITKKAVEDLFQNLPGMAFEMTEACNLKCKYCGYGELYERDSSSEMSNRHLEYKTAKALIDHYKAIIDKNKDKIIKFNQELNFNRKNSSSLDSGSNRKV